MKTLNLLRIAAVQVAVAMGVASCNTDTPEDEKDDENNNRPAQGLVVKLGCTGEYAGNGDGKDLYYVQAFCVEDSGKYDRYAHGLFSVTDSMKVTLEPGAKYLFKATVVKEGMERIAHSEGKNGYMMYGAPFMAELTNGFVYTESFGESAIGSGEAETTAPKKGVFMRPNLGRYYGESEIYTANDSIGGKVDIELLKTYFGIKLTAENFKEGKLCVEMEGAPEMVMEYPVTEFSATFSLANPAEAFRTDWKGVGEYTFDYSETVKIIASTMDEDGNKTPVGSTEVEMKRNTARPLRIILPKDENGFNITIDDEDMIVDDEVVEF